MEKKVKAVEQILGIMQNNEEITVAIITQALRAQSLPEEVHQIMSIMQENEISVDDITRALRPGTSETFDLVCLVDGKPTRVPFEEGKDKNPIGICPKKKLKSYLSLEETGMVSYPDLSEKDKLADEDLCILFMEVRPELNERLRELGKPILSGDYWINGHELSGIGYWMARIREDKLKVDYYDAQHKAKVRKIGHL